MSDLTKGAISGHILKISGYIALTAISQTVYYLTDLYFVGRLGKEAIAGVGIVGNLAIVALALTQSLTVGTTSLVAQALGRKDREQAELVLNQAVLLALAVGALFGVSVFSLRHEYCRWLAADVRTAALGVEYLNWFVPAMLLMFVAAPMGAAQRGTGDMRAATAIQVGIMVLNIILAPILIFGWGPAPRLGVAGASLALCLALGAGCLAYIAFYRRRSGRLRLSRAALKLRLGLWRAILNIGLPTTAEVALSAVTVTLIYGITRPFGAAAQAAYGIGARVMQSFILPANAVAFATSPVAAQNYGARRGDRVRATFYTAAGLSASFMLVPTLVCQLAAPALVRFFNSDPGVVTLGTEYLRISTWAFVIMGVSSVSAGMFQGMGNTVPPLAVSVLRLAVFALPAYTLSSRTGFELHHLWYLALAATAIATSVLLWLLHHECRKRLGFEPAVEPVLRTVEG